MTGKIKGALLDIGLVILCLIVVGLLAVAVRLGVWVEVVAGVVVMVALMALLIPLGSGD
jgi:hypothetical protein